MNVAVYEKGLALCATVGSQRVWQEAEGSDEALRTESGPQLAAPHRELNLPQLDVRDGIRPLDAFNTSGVRWPGRSVDTGRPRMQTGGSALPSPRCRSPEKQNAQWFPTHSSVTPNPALQHRPARLTSQPGKLHWLGRVRKLSWNSQRPSSK
ncbi:hypothetical protein AAFF_G00233190 [Aldrovandia affinis]|uniref:Uncharacterized protein n=1 Tax=Aldrovandia affinis TaxID=143900 RepID=A0AAD7RFG0_9TELE|nr:hypothetical protein AAFF_G00233190 [Aldrovandia affinis]